MVSAVWFVAMNGYAALDATTSLLALVLSAGFYGAVLGVLGGTAHDAPRWGLAAPDVLVWVSSWPTSWRS